MGSSKCRFIFRLLMHPFPTNIWGIFLFVPLLLPNFLQAGEPGAALSQPMNADAQILRGINHLYDNEFTLAENLFRQVTAQHPENPRGYFYLAMVTWSRLTWGHWTKEEVGEFNSRIDQAISVARKRIARQNPDSYTYFYLGGALGFKGRFQLMRQRWASSFFLALDAIEALKTCRSLDPENKDVLMGLGLFDYYTSRLSGVLKFISYILMSQAGKEEGLRKLRVAAEEAPYSSIESKSTLLHIYLFMENDYGNALPIARDLGAKFAKNPRYLYLEGVSCILLDLDSAYKDVLDRLENRGKAFGSKPQATMWFTHAGYLEASYLLFHNRFEDARRRLEGILTRADPLLDPSMTVWPLIKIGMSYDIEGKREKAVSTYTSILSMENGAGAQFLAQKYLEAPAQEKDPFLGY